MPDRRVVLIACALVAAVTAVAFAPVVGHEFVSFDDPLFVTKNPVVQRGLTLAGVRFALTAVTAGTWHPLTFLSHMLDQQLFGAAASGHHLTSLLIHVANAAVLLVVLTSMTGALWPSAVVAALFGVHPLHVESVAWIAERKDVLSTLFFLLGLWAYAAYVRRGGAIRYAGVVAALALGLMAKPMLVTFPVVLLLLDYWPLAHVGGAAVDGMATQEGNRRVRAGRLVVEKLPLFALAALVAAITIAVQHGAGAVRSTTGFPVGRRLGNAALAYVAYLQKTLWPVDLAIFYPYPSAFDPSHVVAAIVVLATVSGFACALVRRAPYVVVGWLWYVVTLLPVIGLVQVGHQSMADRYTYVPLIGVFLAVVFGARAMAQRLVVPPRIVAAAAVVVVVACVAVTRVQLRHWRTSTTLFTHALAVTSDNYIAHVGLGEVLAGEGRDVEAMGHFREAVRIAPTFVEAHLDLADRLLDAQDTTTAIAHYQRALELRPDDATTRAKLANALWRTGRLTEARDAFEEVVRRAPDDAQNLSNLGGVLYALGRRDDALSRFAAAVSLDPSNAAAHGNLGLLLAESGRRDEATRELEEAIRLQPAYAEAHYNLGNLLLREGRPADAAMHYEQALATKPEWPEVHNNLGAALERLGRVAEARARFAEALRLRPDYPAAAANAARLDAGG